MKVCILGSGPVPEELSLELDEQGFAVRLIGLENLEQALPTALAEIPQTANLYVLAPSMPLKRLSFRRRLVLVDAMKKICAKISRRIPVVLVSSCLVFDGLQERAYSESDKPNPVSDEAKVWLRWENLIQKQFTQHMILRPGWLLSRDKNYISSELKPSFGAHMAPDKVPYAEGNPVSPRELVRALVAVIKQLDSGANCNGVYHFSAKDVFSSPQLLKYLAPESYLRIDDDVPRLNYQLDCKRILNSFGIQQRDW